MKTVHDLFFNNNFSILYGSGLIWLKYCHSWNIFQAGLTYATSWNLRLMTYVFYVTRVVVEPGQSPSQFRAGSAMRIVCSDLLCHRIPQTANTLRLQSGSVGQCCVCMCVCLGFSFILIYNPTGDPKFKWMIAQLAILLMGIVHWAAWNDVEKEAKLFNMPP